MGVLCKNSAVLEAFFSDIMWPIKFSGEDMARVWEEDFLWFEIHVHNTHGMKTL